MIVRIACKITVLGSSPYCQLQPETRQEDYWNDVRGD